MSMIVDRARAGHYLLSFAVLGMLAMFTDPAASIAIAAVMLLALAAVAIIVPIEPDAVTAAGPRTARNRGPRHGLARQCDPDAAGQVRSRAPGQLG
jgi:uncharacterized protein DUF6412